jgi:hypothetical protein
MSTFMGFACVDLRPGAAQEPFVAALDDAMSKAAEPGSVLTIHISAHQDRQRLFLIADYGNIWLSDVLVSAVATTDLVERATLGLDHDEYGIEHVVLDCRGGQPCRLQHVYIYPDGEPNDDYEALVTTVPACANVDVSADGLVDGPRSWSALAALYEVPVHQVEDAARRQANAHDELGLVFTPFEPWWNALGLDYAGGEPADITLTSPRSRR